MRSALGFWSFTWPCFLLSLISSGRVLNCSSFLIFWHPGPHSNSFSQHWLCNFSCSSPRTATRLQQWEWYSTITLCPWWETGTRIVMSDICLIGPQGSARQPLLPWDDSTTAPHSWQVSLWVSLSYFLFSYQTCLNIQMEICDCSSTECWSSGAMKKIYRLSWCFPSTLGSANYVASLSSGVE